MAPNQTQAVLRRTSSADPLLLVGITLDETFYPRTAADATETLVLTKGLVALAPLSAVDAADTPKAAVIANADAGVAWHGLEPGPNRRTPA